MSRPDQEKQLIIGEESDRRNLEDVRNLLLSLSQLLQVSRFHDVRNAALVGALETVSRLTREVCRDGQILHVLVDAGQVFADRRRVRFATGAFNTVRDLIRQIEGRGLSGFELRAPLGLDGLRGLLAALHAVPLDSDDARATLEAGLAGADVTAFVPLAAGGGSGSEAGTIDLPESKLAALLYAKLVVVLRESLRHWDSADRRHYLGARTKRVVQQIISLAERSPRPFQWLIHVKSADEYLSTHSANVAILSILTGLRIGLERSRVCALGMAALFHDMGRIGLPGDLLAKTTTFDADEIRAMARHPVLGVNLLLKLGTLNETLLERLVVVWEHNIESNGYPRKSSSTPLHAFSRIVAVADAFDAMTTRRAYRAARTPDEAMRELTRYSGERYDPDVVRAFRAVLGVYPLGTLLRLDTGEAGLVFHVDPSRPATPLVKLVLGPDGASLADGEIVDLSETGPDGAPRRKVVGSDDPQRLGIHVPAYLMEGAS